MTQCAEIQKPEQKPEQRFTLPGSGCVSVMVSASETQETSIRECTSNIYKYKMLSAAYNHGL